MLARTTCVLISLAAFAVPRLADACSFPCGLSIEHPRTDDPHPANAALHIVGCSDFADTMLSVTVDGAPASLVPAIAPSEASYGWTSISPPPAPGQEVIIEQCGEEAPTYGECPDPPAPVEVLRYVVGPDDLDAPPTAGTVTLAHTFGPADVACMDIGDIEFHVEITGLDQGDETAVLYAVVLDIGLPDRYSDALRTEWIGPDAVDSLSFDIGQHLELAMMPPEEACVTVTAMDLAGHVTAIAEACGSTALNAPPSAGESSGGDESGGDDSGDAGTTTDEPPIEATSTSDEPADADADVADRGCACGTSHGSVPGLFALLVVASLRPRRRSARR